MNNESGLACTSPTTNNYGLLRLLFASLVILSHAPELLDGNRSRELATRIWGTMSFGEIAVDGFFVISGFLITQSFFNSRSVRSYMFKRILRIYPAFFVASLFLLFVVLPLAGAHGAINIWAAAGSILVLSPPAEGSVFAGPIFNGLHVPVLNGAMWSVSYEFRCYLAVIVIGTLALHRAPWFLAGVCLAMLFAYSSGVVPHWVVPHVSEFGYLPNDVRTGGVFLVGVLFYLWRAHIPIRAYIAVPVAVALFFLMYFKVMAEPAFAILGGYLIIWLAQVDWLKPISVRLKDDISYGVYLYA